MGISAGGKSGAIKSDINVTPLVDIVLVLLIIFLVTMPVMMRQITIEVPRQLDDDEATPLASKQIIVTLAGDGSVTVSDGSEDKQIPRIELARTIRPMLESKKTEKVVFVEVGDDVPYGEAVSAMDTIKGAGASKVALKTDDPTATPTP